MSVDVRELPLPTIGSVFAQPAATQHTATLPTATQPTASQPTPGAARPGSGARERLQPIDLATLVAAGSLQTRQDRKYLIPAAALPGVLAGIGPDTCILEIDGHRTFGYRSVYFDTPALTTYRLAAQRRPNRFKVRTRTYLDTGECWLEVKTRDGRGRTVKVRTPHDAAEAGRLPTAAWDFLADAMPPSLRTRKRIVGELAPALTTYYQRATLLLPAEGVRVTMDTGLTALDWRDATLQLPGHTIVETKSASSASRMDRLLWELGHRPIRLSKYATSLAALHPELPANAWKPALRRLTAGRAPAHTPPHQTQPEGRS